MFTLDDTRLTFKEYFTSTSVSLCQLLSGHPSLLARYVQVTTKIVVHLPKLNTFLQSSHLSNHNMHNQLDCLYFAHTSIG